MSGPFTLRIVRPYASRDDFLQGDYWTVERSEMLLLGVEGVAPGAPVTFEIVLENREIVVRGEGRALELVAPRDGKPGGVRVRFKQLDAESKATLRRALEIQRKQAAQARTASPEMASVAAKEPEQQNAAPAETTTPTVDVVAAPPAPTAQQAEPEREEPSGVHQRIAGPIHAPENREALLQRLRQRSQLRKGAQPVEKNTAAAE